jgi:hypothetical protein
MNPSTAPLTPREQITTKLNRIAQLTTTLNEATAPFSSQIEALLAACATATQRDRDEIEQLTDEVEKLAAAHAPDLFDGKARVFQHNAHRITRSEGKAVDCDDEESVIELALDLAESGADDATKMSAAACIKTKHTIDKQWIRSKWKKHGEWFAQFLGLRLKTTTTYTVEIDGSPALKKAKKKTGSKVESTTEEPQLQEAA